MKNGSITELFTALGERLGSFGDESVSRRAIAEACDENHWFSAESVYFAVDAIHCRMLAREPLRSWLENYGEPVAKPKKVGVIAAGNIPLVGFFDMMCTVASGHECYLKSSSKDRAMTNYIVESLRGIDPHVAIYDYDESVRLDAVIATGSDNTNRYFKARYPDIRSLFRGHRSSMAVLSGMESDEELRGLGFDIFIYNGLGCRNISLLAMPEGYDIEHLADIFSSCRNLTGDGYAGNYRQTKAMMNMAGEMYVNGGFFVIAHSTDFPSSISRINCFEYANRSEIERWITANDLKIQCIESDCIEHPRRVGFGKAQLPDLTDYPDGVDIMAFLHSL